MSEINTDIAVCPKCDGEGFLMNRGQQIAAGIISLGLFPLVDAAMSNSVRDSEFSRRCNVCRGHGVVRVPT
ncbi:hypothetical protein LB553_00955 [Mesorhizobium sp. CA8]|uniref:hypothetical protein n=1 Tax=Mesorhizobium sp. CA8 TaxID=2876637 RepID=UPI001CC9C6BC|nr:hypothetical protein [Mesorhizobium sp. CA8]MBZ9759456.1 hypothetical protein [Mesorhizobium sp. CA8]